MNSPKNDKQAPEEKPEPEAELAADQEANQPDENFGLAEQHAIQRPGHSVTVIQDLSIGKDGVAETVLLVTCNGTPAGFMNDERDCTWYQVVKL